MVGRETVLNWLHDAWRKLQPISVRSTGNWTEKGELVLRIESPAGEIADVTLDDFAAAKGIFLVEIAARNLTQASA